MAAPEPPNLPTICAVVGRYTAPGGATAISRWHVNASGATALDVFNRFTTAWQAANMGHAAVGVRLTRLDITRLDRVSATESFTTAGTKWDGTTAGEHSPAVAMLVKYTTGFRDLGSIGHTYMPFVAEAAQVNGALLAGQLAASQSGFTTFVNTLTTQTIPLVVCSYGRFNHATLPDLPATFHTVTAVAVSGILATQRKRQSRLRV